MGGAGSETTDREIPRISLRDFEGRRSEITDELWSAAADIGFFQLADHGIDAAEIDAAFAAAAAFFALPDAVKAQHALKKGQNAGWEKLSQVRPSTGTADQKESFQVTRPRMAGLWPDEAELAGFQATMLGFERRCWELATRVLSCFADRLGLPRAFFTAAHDPARATYQSTLRLLHYLPLPPGLAGQPGIWRAGAHTDFDCLTLLFQRAGQAGLQVMPGKEADDERWTSVPATADAVTCNVGDMLMRWSDDALASTFHRVRLPGAGEDAGPRYSIGFFAQANTDVVISSPSGRYPDITAGDYLHQRIQANFAG
ncbi:isopenicillin N synthase family oxygenase [Frankia sp. CN7]|nr:isopenicillin N synthase family oxygenase [Frankia nepalensis]MBL7510729.1 isopenicillin N synthase family oxygenase [Frankia nepalensis]